MIFTGRGQLAMANAGSTSTYKGTNGSQFFVTTGSPRHLDFNHTIFGQLVRGWEVLEKMQNVPVMQQFVDPRNPTGDREVSRPQAEIRITETALEPNFSDALLVLSATSAGQATIRVVATDIRGATAERSFTVKAVKDTRNSPPFFSRTFRDRTIPKGRSETLTMLAQDLEQDYLQYASGLLSASNNGTSQQSGTQVKVVPSPGYTGPLTLAYGVTQFDMGAENARDYDELRSVLLAVGDMEFRTEAVPVIAAPGATLNNVPVARYIDSDPRGQAGASTISINWGDGTPTSAGILARENTRPTLGGYRVFGSHVYARAGVYPVVVTFSNSNTGLSEVVRSVAVISDKAVRVIPEDEQRITTNAIKDRRLAKIVDSATGTKAEDYEVTLDWGDGDITPGEVTQTGAGELFIVGSHTYRDPDAYSVAIRVHKKGTENAVDATGWASLDVRFAAAEQFLPPFPMAHLVAGISSVIDTKDTPSPQDDVEKPFRSFIGANRDAVLTFNLVILNGGNKKSPPAKIRFYASADRTLNLKDETYTDDSSGTPVTRTNPKDVLLTIGKSQKDLNVISLAPGKGGGLDFDLTGGNDMRVHLPKGENGVGQYLLVHLDYDDKLADQSPIPREAVREIAPIFTPLPASLEVTETPGPKHTQPFSIKFEKRPTHNITIPLAIVNGSGVDDTTELYFNAALPVPPENNPTLPPDQNLVSSPDQIVTYTPAMWDAGTKEVVVQVTGKQDNTKDGDQFAFVQMGPTTSDDPRYHAKYGSALRVTIRDRDSLITVSPVNLTTTEAAGGANSKTFTVRVTKKPVADVILPIVNGDPSEGQVTATAGVLTEVNGKPSLTFTTAETYPATRTITVTSVDDVTADGNVSYTITVGPSSSADPEFNGIDPQDITVVNIDNPPPVTP
jgi:hypothetical protein